MRGIFTPCRTSGRGLIVDSLAATPRQEIIVNTTRVVFIAAMLGMAAPAFAQNCGSVPNASQLRTWLQAARSNGGEAGGLFHGPRWWPGVLNRDGAICATAASQSDPTQVGLASQAIANAKPYTANAFSLAPRAFSPPRL